MTTTSALAQLPTHERRLDNGLRVIVREDHSSPVVSIVTHVSTGYFDEPDDLVGISHVLEHMYFKGTERRQPGDMARETKSAGGYLNAGTIYDHTSYYTVLPSSALEQGLDIQSDALLHSEIDEDELRRELAVIIQEAKRKLDNAAAVAQESLFETMFDVHRIRRWRIGTEDLLRSLTRAEVWRYYRDLYRPANVILVIAGDVDPQRAFERAEHYYGRMPPGEETREPAPAEPARQGFRFRELTGDIVHTHVEWGWRSPGPLHPDTPALDLLAVVLGQGRAARLYRSVRERGLASAVSAYNYTPATVGVFGVSAELRPEDSRAALVAIARTIESVRTSPPRSAELERARNMLEARLIRRMETAEGQASLLAEWQALGDWRHVDTYLAQLLSATAEDLRSAAE
ncbi:MAG: M16 family metallopeptidase, partial [Longimicrobiales bacterium]